MGRKQAFVVFLCSYSSNAYTGDVLVLCGFLTRVALYSCSLGRCCCKYKTYVFLVILKSNFGSLRVVTTVMYLTPVL